MKQPTKTKTTLISTALLGISIATAGCNANPFIRAKPLKEKPQIRLNEKIDLVVTLKRRNKPTRISSNLWIRLHNIFVRQDGLLLDLTFETSWVKGRKRNGKLAWGKKLNFIHSPIGQRFIISGDEETPKFTIIVLSHSKNSIKFGIIEHDIKNSNISSNF